MKKITVLIVDDSAFIRTILSEMLSEVSDIEVIGAAHDAADARTKIKQLNPDVVTLDIEMPGMNGIDFLEKIMTLRPTPVIMISTLTLEGADITLRALDIGAVDYISKPTSNLRHSFIPMRDELAEKIRTAAAANILSRSRTPVIATTRQTDYSYLSSTRVELIAIGSSTGGVEALRALLMSIPPECPPIVMTQHMPATFTSSFAKRLNGIVRLSVSEATQRVRLKPGHAYLAPGDQHMSVARIGDELVCKLSQGPLVSGHRPSVDVLFQSVSETVGTHAVGIILTGMGRDGAEGLLAMRQAGAYTIGQSASSCVVYGMPRAANEIGGVVEEVPLDGIAGKLLKFCQSAQVSA